MERDSNTHLVCEHCNDTIEHVGVAHSAVAVLQKVTIAGYSYFQCEEGQDYSYVNWQHFHCSHDHMTAFMRTCINEHYTEEALHPIAPGGGTTILHKIVLGSHLCCKVCKVPLSDVAYRFCLTHCTPVNAIPDDSHSEHGEWCCSLEHARSNVHAIIGNETWHAVTQKVQTEEGV